MASQKSKPCAQTYNMLTDIQKNILKQHYDGGMIGTGRQYDEMITHAAEETRLPRNKVEVSLQVIGLVPLFKQGNQFKSSFLITTRARSKLFLYCI